ncbi:unnamed protein product [marine sediment metagenome]|uniref:Uncharacterized protein n=1 Tax=marine sediment metagenome TaxID=412755 RepID=X0Z9A4_9ZZZZ
MQIFDFIADKIYFFRKAAAFFQYYLAAGITGFMSKNTAMLDNLVEDILLSDVINLEPLHFKRIKFLYSRSKKNGSRGVYENLWHYITNIADRYGQVKKGNDMYGELKKISGLVSAVEDFLQISSKNVFDFA